MESTERSRIALHRSQARTNAGTDHNTSETRSGTMRASIQAATASIRTPKSFFTSSIQGPGFGRSRPAEAPTISNGVPMPIPAANSAAPPRAIAPVWLMTSSAPTSTGATQVVTMSAESAPISAAPPKVPADCRLLISARRDWTTTGICSVNTPNIDNARVMNTTAKSAMTHHCWNIACTSLPAAALATPAIAYVIAMPST